MELMIIKQLPIIEEQFKEISAKITEKKEFALSLVANEDTVKQLKQIRADFNKEFKAFEDKRKEIKDEVMKPYNEFESTYKACISDAYKTADASLKSKIDTVEGEIKAVKENTIRYFFNELCEAHKIDFVTFEQLNLNITLSASEKSLKEDVSDLINRYVDDLALIETQENKSEILVEYKKSLNVSQAIRAVSERLKAIEEEQKRREAREAAKVEKAEIPVEISVEEPEATPIINFFTAAPFKPEHTILKIKVANSQLEDVKFYLELNGIEVLDNG